MTQIETTGVPRLLLTPEEAAASLGISRSLVYELMRAERLASVKIGGCRRVPMSAIEDFVHGLLGRPQPHPNEIGDRQRTMAVHSERQRAVSPIPAGYRRATVGVLLRAVIYGAVALPFIVGLARSVHRGYAAIGDGAVISLKAFAVLSTHPPLVGQMTNLRGVYGFGPLEYDLLAIPVHLSPTLGAYVGSVVWAVGACAIAVEAVWAMLGPIGGMLTGAVVLGNFAWWPEIVLRPWWNPFFGEMWFVAALASACAVITGRRAWWPAVVVSSSVAMQAHFLFAVTSLLLVFVTLGHAVVATHRARASWRWLMVGSAAGLLCWAQPLWQEVTARSGNLSLLASSQGGYRRTGLGFGLRTLGFVASPQFWTVNHLRSYVQTSGEIVHTPWELGFAVLTLAIAALGVARLFRSTVLAAVALVTLVACVGLVVTFSVVPSQLPAFGTISYLVSGTFGVEMLVAATVITSVVLLGRRALANTPALGIGEHPGFIAAARGTGLALLAGLTFVSLAAQPRGLYHERGDWAMASVIRTASDKIVRAVPTGPVVVNLHGASGVQRYSELMGIVWSVKAAGLEPQTILPAGETALGPDYKPAVTRTSAVVTLTHGEVVVSLHRKV